MAFESKRIFELHIFKDANKTNWTNPSVYVFPLSSQSFLRFNRADQHPENRTDRYSRPYDVGPALPYTSRDGLLNLWKCGPEQLAFLQRHIDERNRHVREDLEKIHQEYKRQKHEDAKFNQEEQKRYRDEIEKFNEKSKKERGETNDSSSPTRALPPPVRTRGDHDSVYNVPPSPIPYARPGRYDPYYQEGLDRRALPGEPELKLRKARINPAIFESTWTLDSVELDLDPFESVFRSDAERGIWKPLPEGKEQKKVQGWQKGGLKIARYRLSEEGKHEFAIVLSRNVAVKKLPGRQDDLGYRGRRRRLDSCDDYSEYSPLGPEGSVCGEQYLDEEEAEEEAKGKEEEEKEKQAEEETVDGEDHDLEVIPSPNETSVLELEDGKQGE